MSLISSLSKAWSWFTKVFVSHTESAAEVAVTLTETVKSLLANPIAGFLLNVADAVTGTQVPTIIANDINALIPKILAVELGIEGLPVDPTPDQILSFETAILKAFNVSANNSKLYTELGSQIYGIVQTNIANGTTNFAAWVDAVEQAYKDYQKDLSANAVVTISAPITTTTTVVEPANNVPTPAVSETPVSNTPTSTDGSASN